MRRNIVDDLKVSLTTVLMLSLPQTIGQYTINTDVCGNQVGCGQLQVQGDKILKPICYWLCKLCDAETQNDTTQKQYLVVVWAMSLLLTYLKGSLFITKTDHKFLQCILVSKSQLESCFDRDSEWWSLVYQLFIVTNSSSSDGPNFETT